MYTRKHATALTEPNVCLQFDISFFFVNRLSDTGCSSGLGHTAVAATTAATLVILLVFPAAAGHGRFGTAGRGLLRQTRAGIQQQMYSGPPGTNEEIKPVHNEPAYNKVPLEAICPTNNKKSRL